MKKAHKLSVFSMAMINVAIIMSLRGLPLMAKEGLTMIFYILFSAILFLIPISLVSAELAAGWPQEGGVYRWVKEAFGSKLGFTAIWLQWIQNTIWYPTVLAFTAGALSYLFLDPALASNKVFTFSIILIVYWSATLLNFKGLKTVSWVATAGVIGGTIFPAALIIILGVVWIISGNPLEFMKVPLHILPDFTKFNTMTFLGGIIVLFAGMEVGAVHIKDMKDPKKNYPLSIFIAFIIIITIFLLGSFAIASVLPADEISLTAGIMQGFKELLSLFHLDFMLPVIGFLIAFGAIGGIVAWISGPSKGLLATAKEGDLPPFLQHTNKRGVQTHILLLQGAIVTILSGLFILMPNVSSAFFLLTALTATLYIVMYLLVFAAAIKLRYSKPNVKRSYKIPGGKVGIWLVAGIGFIAVLFAFIVSFFPPKQLEVGSPLFYVLFLAIGVIVFVSLPMIINQYKSPKWVQIKKSKKRK